MMTADDTEARLELVEGASVESLDLEHPGHAHDLFALSENLLDRHVMKSVVSTEVVHLLVDREQPLITLQGGEGLFDPTWFEGMRDASVGVVDDFFPVDRELLTLGEVEDGVDGWAVVVVWYIEEADVVHVVLVRGSREERRGRGCQLRRHVVLMKEACRHVCKVRSGGQ